MRGLLAYLKKQTTLLLVLAIGWSLGIFIGCSMPGKDLPKVHVFDHLDKVIHFTFFFVFYLLWYTFKPKVLLLLLAAALYGFGLEFYQMYCVQGRSFDIWDGLADTAGALVAALILHKTQRS